MVRVKTDKSRDISEVLHSVRMHGCDISADAEQLVRDPRFEISNGEEYNVVFVTDSEIYGQDRSSVFQMACERGYTSPPASLTLLLPGNFSPENPKLREVTCSEPVLFRGRQVLLGIDYGAPKPKIVLWDSLPRITYGGNFAFAFLAPDVRGRGEDLRL